MSDNEVTIQINTQVDETQINQLKETMEELTGKEVNIVVDTDTAEAEEELENVRQIIHNIDQDGANITTNFHVEGDDQVFSTIEEAEARLAELDGETATMNMDVDSSGMEKLKNETNESKNEASEASDAFGGLGDAISLIGGAIAATGILSFLDEVASSASSVEEQFYAMSLNLDLDAGGLIAAKTAINELNDDTLVSKGSIRGFVNQLALMGVGSAEVSTDIMDLSAKLSYLQTGSNDAAESIATMFANSIGSGKMMERQFVRNGVSLDAMAERAGMTKESMIDLYKTMSPSERASFLTQYAGDAKDLEEAGKRLPETWDALKDKIDQKIGAISTSIGQTVLPILKPALDFIGDAVQGVADFIGALPDGAKVALGITLIGIAIGSIATVIWVTAIPAISGLIGSVIALEIAGAPLILIVAAIALAIGLIVAAIFEFGKAMGWWTDFGSMLESIKAGIMRLWSAFTNNEHVKAVIQWLKDAWQGLMDFLKPTFDAINQWWSSMFPAQDGSFDIVRSIIDVLGLLGDGISVVVGTIIIPYLQLLWSVWSTIFGFIGAIITGIVIPYLQTLWTFWTTVFNAIVSILQWYWSAYSTIFNAVVSFIGKVVAAFNNFKNKVMGVVTTVIGYWNQFKQGVNTAVNAVKGFIDGLVSKFLDMKNKVMSYLQPIVDTLNTILGKQSQVEGGSGGSPFEETYYNGGAAGSPFEEAESKGESWYPPNNGGVTNIFNGLVTERDVTNLIIKTMEDYNGREATRS